MHHGVFLYDHLIKARNRLQNRLTVLLVQTAIIGNSLDERYD
jgi:hypothetical protein